MIQIAGLMILISAFYLQSYNGRQDIVRANRAGCERGSTNLAAIVNTLRPQQIADQQIAADPSVPPSVRADRQQSAASEVTALLVLDSHIDHGLWRHLHSRVDQDVVRDGVSYAGRRLPPFHCDAAYPATSPFRVLP